MNPDIESVNHDTAYAMFGLLLLYSHVIHGHRKVASGHDINPMQKAVELDQFGGKSGTVK